MVLALVQETFLFCPFLLAILFLNVMIMVKNLKTMFGKREKWADREEWRLRYGRRGKIFLFGKRDFGRESRCGRIRNSLSPPF